MTIENNDADSGASLSNEGLAAGSCEVSTYEINTMEKGLHEPLASAYARLLKNKGVPTVGYILPKPDPRFVIERMDNLETGGETFKWWPLAANVESERGEPQ